jgi:UDP-3-O-[3-hydroxymyristoyl] glucosamine N-acyltransferase
VRGPEHLARAEASPALAIIVPLDVTNAHKPIIRVADARLAFGRALQRFDWRTCPEPGIHPMAIVASSARVDSTAAVGPFVVVGERVTLAAGVVVGAHTVIGDEVTVGRGTRVDAHVTIYAHCTLGERVIVRSGTVIGADGFGYQQTDAGWEAIPQLGTVRIEDDVELGANVCVDRATTGVTIIGRGTKLDNLVQIGHNVHIGRHCMIVGQVGIGGSAIIQDNVILAGQAGVKDHVTVGEGAMLGAQSGVLSNIPAGSMYSGSPARPHSLDMRCAAAFNRLPELVARVRTLERMLADRQAPLPSEEDPTNT